MKTLIDYASGYKWILIDKDSAQGYGQQLNICTADPASHSLRNASHIDYLILFKGTTPVLMGGMFGTNLFTMVREGSRVPAFNFVYHILHLINVMGLRPVDTGVSQSFSMLGFFEYNGHWQSIRKVKPNTQFGTSLNLNNLRVGSVLPEGLVVHGNLSLCRTNLRHLPNDLWVDGVLDVRFNPRLKLTPVSAKEIRHD